MEAETAMAEQPGHRVKLRNGMDLSCVVCRNDSFHEREWQLNTAGMSFFNLDFLNRSAICYICAECRYIHWFNL
ncbi:hypothetical protein O4J56_07450 [Nocardiopsis sp. RSe5-2]|uniref:DNA-binding protein n=1 Tax=Nocardiopsis endophytica TaxID=3018445 RepID=A0ABT4U0K6_9ACTN|nr:hypothetical protein [Nocardiopsis endophytica]MDA2810468.1 hypothetical protein [Nocardiopsis endophytica]